MTPFSQAELDEYAASFNGSALIRHQGFQLSFVANERAIISLEVRDIHRGGMGTDAVSGAVIAAMFDFVLGNTAMLAPPLRRNATVHLSIALERGLRGDRVRCEAHIDRATRTLLFSSAQMLDGEGNVCAHASGVVSLGKEVSFDEWRAAVSAPPGARRS